MPRDPTEAAVWFRLAAEAGEEQAKHDLAALVMKGSATTEDSIRTREWFEQAAASGDPIAAYNYGVCLAEGVGVERNDNEAAIWLRRAAESVVNAQYWYGRMMLDGRGMTANPAEAQIWIAKAAYAGLTDAQVLLGEMLISARGGTRDHAEALALFEKAATAGGHVGAMFAMGALLGGGHDVPWDRPKAQHWFRMAAERGHGIAQQMLGRYLSRSLAGDLDIKQARMWFERAQAAGVDVAGDLALLPPDEPAAAAPTGPDVATA